tara:strand:- start:270 stop:512 length:243 start_codon:yes stop_codon:yes gene_type:complete
MLFVVVFNVYTYESTRKFHTFMIFRKLLLNSFFVQRVYTLDPIAKAVSVIKKSLLFCKKIIHPIDEKNESDLQIKCGLAY